MSQEYHQHIPLSRRQQDRWLRQHRMPLMSLAAQLELTPGAFSVLTVRGCVSLQAHGFQVKLSPMPHGEMSGEMRSSQDLDPEPVKFNRDELENGTVLIWCRNVLMQESGCDKL